MGWVERRTKRGENEGEEGNKRGMRAEGGRKKKGRKEGE